MAMGVVVWGSFDSISFLNSTTVRLFHPTTESWESVMKPRTEIQILNQQADLSARKNNRSVTARR